MNSQTPIAVSDGLQKELEYRRKKQWDIFSWCSTLLVAITGGVIALRARESAFMFSSITKVIISLAVLALFFYAAFWIIYNGKKKGV